MKIIEMLERSGATEAFRAGLLRFLRDWQPNEHVAFNAQCPPVKVERALTRALEEYPHLPIESIEVRGSSGCEFFRGALDVHTAAEVRRVRFHWDCKWKAEQMGWRDYFGFPDQGRAAREFGHQCFRAWSEDEVLLKHVRLADASEAGAPVPA